MLLPEAGTLERAATYRDKKIKPLFLQIKNKVGAMVAQVKELTKELENWKGKYQKLKQKYNSIQKELDEMRKDNQKLAEEFFDCKVFCCIACLGQVHLLSISSSFFKKSISICCCCV